MITAVDTNVLLDVFRADARFGAASREALRAASDAGQLVACEVVWAETLAHFESVSTGIESLETLRIVWSPLERLAAQMAARAWHEYRRRGGRRTRVIADFLIGAHAQGQADRLLSRDRGFYRTYFSGLAVIKPSGGQHRPE